MHGWHPGACEVGCKNWLLLGVRKGERGAGISVPETTAGEREKVGGGTGIPVPKEEGGCCEKGKKV